MDAILFYLMFMLGINEFTSLARNVNSTMILHNTIATETVKLPCNGVSWKHADGIMSFDKFFIDTRFGDSFTLFDNFTLCIKSVSLQHEDIYECHHNATRVIKHVLTVNGKGIFVLTRLVSLILYLTLKCSVSAPIPSTMTL